MEHEIAVELANEWHDLTRGNKVLNAQYNNLLPALTRLLPAAIRKGGAAVVNGSPSVLACDESAVYIVDFVPADRDTLNVRFARHPLAPGASISGSDDFDEERVARTRHWRFTWPGGVEIAFTSVTDRHSAWKTGPDSADGVARFMAQALGWEFPA